MKINASLDEIADDKAALSQQQREEMEATLSSDMLATERSECSAMRYLALIARSVVRLGSAGVSVLACGGTRGLRVLNAA